MIRFLLRTLISLAVAAIALLFAAWIVDGVTLQPSGFVLGVAVFALAQALLSPLVAALARKYASALLGGIGLVSVLLALFVATLVPGGLRIEGATAWVLAALVVWIITALGTWLLGFLLIERWWNRRKAVTS